MKRISDLLKKISKVISIQAVTDRKTKSGKEREVEMLLAASKYILETEDFNKVARHVFDASCELTGATSGYVAMLTPDGSENEVLFLESGGAECTVDPYLPMPIRGLRGVAYAEGKAVYDNDFSSSKWMKNMPEGHMSLANVLFAPLNISGKTVGIVGIANKPSDFTDEDAHLIESFANLAAISLKNSRYLESIIEEKSKVEKLLKEREVLLTEVHHRTKNNMLMISNLLALSDSCEEAQKYVKNMMVLYDKLYRSKNFTDIPMNSYLKNLVQQIMQVLDIENRIDVKIDFADIQIDSKILFPLGIIINEILTNSVKYAFSGINNPKIVIRSVVVENSIILSVSDNGSGFDYNKVEEESNSFGVLLIRLMSDDIKAIVKYSRNPESCFTITVPIC